MNSVNGCRYCETAPVVHLNGEGFCAHHAEQMADFSARCAPPIADTRRVEMHPQHGTSCSANLRHYK